jgi:lysophospholipase L1-like esterase
MENVPSAYPQLDGKSTYVALGDGTAVPNGYVELLAARLKADYGVAGYTNYAKDGNTVAKELLDLGSREALADADLITVGFGNITLINRAIASALGTEEIECDWEDLVGEERVAYVYSALEAVRAEIAAMGLGEETAGMLNAFLESFAFGAAEYAIKLPKLIEAIREINKDASIVILGQYNPMNGVVVQFGEVSLDVTLYINYFVRAVASHGVAYCALSGEAIFVEIPDVTTSNADMEWTIGDLFKLLMKNFASLNPNDAGESYIVERILGALHINEQPPKKILLGDANGDEKVNLRDAIMVLQAANGKDVAIDGEAADVTDDGKVNLQDAIRILKRANGNTSPFPGEK